MLYPLFSSVFSDKNRPLDNDVWPLTFILMAIRHAKPFPPIVRQQNRLIRKCFRREKKNFFQIICPVHFKRISHQDYPHDTQLDIRYKTRLIMNISWILCTSICLVITVIFFFLRVIFAIVIFSQLACRWLHCRILYWICSSHTSIIMPLARTEILWVM